MPSPTFGAKSFTKVIAKSESTYGTAATFTGAVGQIIMVDALGAIDLGIELNTGDDRTVGVRTQVLANRPVITSRAPVITWAETDADMRALPIALDSLATITATGAGPYVWTWSPSQTAVDTYKGYSLLLLDGVQQYVASGCVPTEITLSGDGSGTLQYGVTWAAIDIATNGNASTQTPAAPALVPSRLFKLYTDSAFPDGSGDTEYDHVMSFTATIEPGLTMISALDASLVAATAAYTGPLNATMELTVASNSAAIANGAWGIDEIGEQRYLRLTALTSAGYGLELRGSWIIETITPLGADQDGLVVNTVGLRLAYDQTSTKSIEIAVTSPLSARP